MPPPIKHPEAKLRFYRYEKDYIYRKFIDIIIKGNGLVADWMKIRYVMAKVIQRSIKYHTDEAYRKRLMQIRKRRKKSARRQQADFKNLKKRYQINIIEG